MKYIIAVIMFTLFTAPSAHASAKYPLKFNEIGVQCTPKGDSVYRFTMRNNNPDKNRFANFYFVNGGSGGGWGTLELTPDTVGKFSIAIPDEGLKSLEVWSNLQQKFLRISVRDVMPLKCN